MRIEITDSDLINATVEGSVSQRMIRNAAYFLLLTIGDMPNDEAVVPAGTSAPPPTPPVAPAAMAPAANTAVVSAAANTSPSSAAPTSPTVPLATGSPVPANVPPPPLPPVPVIGGDDDYDDPRGTFGAESNVVTGNFPQAGNVPPPPPASVANTAATNTTPVLLSVANGAAVVGSAASAEVDSAGMQYDARIHQKAKGKKKDLTWKLIKGIDPAIVQAVTAELAARKGASAPVSLPPTDTTAGTNTVPVPPVANVPAPPGMPAPPAGGNSSSVPIPPSPAVGLVGASAYRALIDKITDLTRANKITPAKVSEICQSNGAPSLMALNSMQHLIADVEKMIDAAALGLV